MTELIEILICLVSLSLFTGLFIYYKCFNKFEKLAKPLRKINTLSNPDDRLKQAFPDETTRKTVEKIIMKIPKSINKLFLYLFMGLSLLVFIALFTHILKKYIDSFPPIWGKVGSGLATLGVMFITLGNWSMQSYSNETLTERIRDILLFILWTTGTFLIFMS